MGKAKVVTIEDRIPKLKQKRKQKANRRLVIYLSFFFLILLGVLYFQSPISKLASITVNGTTNILDSEIVKLSGLSKRTSFWKVNKDEVIQNIMEHQEVKDVTITKRLPNHIVINVKEHKRVGYLVDGSKMTPLLANGDILTSVNNSGFAVDAPLLFSWNGEKEIETMASELKKLPAGISNLISEIHLTPTESDPLQITLFMNNGYEVKATIRNFADKMAAYPSIIRELDPALHGIIHLDVVPFLEPYKTEEESEEGDDLNEGEG